MKVAHIHRLLRLITLLQSEEDVSVAELAETLRVSRRTVFRDINSLKSAGIPIRFDSASWRYVIGAEFFLPPLNLTEREARSLLLLSHLAVQTASIPYPEDVKTALEKLTCTMSPEIRASCREAIRVVEPWVRPLPHDSSSPAVFEAVWQATVVHQVLDIRCESPQMGREIRARFHPYRIVWTIRGWYVLGFNEDDRKIAALSLDWILHAAPTGKRFAPTPCSAQEFFGDAWRMDKGSQRYHVRVRFLPQSALAIDDLRWHPTQQTEFLEDGSLVFEADVDGLEEICGWVLGYGPDAVVESPVALQSLVRTKAARAALLYDNTEFTYHAPLAREDVMHHRLGEASGTLLMQGVAAVANGS